MATINRAEILEDVKFWLPINNTLSDANLNKIIELVITQVGDDNDNYEEVLCKSLKTCAAKNKTDAGVDLGGLKRQKVGTFDEEYFQGASISGWDDFLKALPGLCSSTIGYTFSTEGIGRIYIAPGDEIDVNDTSNSDLYL